MTGASGVGKTTLLGDLETSYPDTAQAYYHFDDIGVPSSEEMETEYGSIEAWQKMKTERWVERLLQEESDQRVIIEGQSNLNFIREAFAKYDFNNYQIILIDCNEDEMVRRLLEDRKQSELVNPDMKNWLRYLRNQATELGVPIIDTGLLSREASLEQLRKVCLVALV